MMKITTIEYKQSYFMQMVNTIISITKKLTTTKRGYILVGSQTKAYNPRYARYTKLVE